MRRFIWLALLLILWWDNRAPAIAGSTTDGRTGPAVTPPAAAKNAAQLHQLLAIERRALDFRTSHQPDSTIANLYRAVRLGEQLRVAYPLEVADIFFDVGTFYWQQGAYDSAAHYFEAAAARIRTSGYDLRSRRRIRLGNDAEINVGDHLASRYANAGLAWRRQGNLALSVRFYDQALTLYQQHHQTSGLRWLLCLLGEAYEEQGNTEQAKAYYEQALRLIATQPASKAWLRAGQLNDLLRYYADLLLAENRTPYLLTLIRRGLADDEVQKPGGLTPVGARLRLVRAEAWIAAHYPDSAAAELHFLATAPPAIGSDERAGLPPSAQEEWLKWHCLSARIAHQRGQTANARQHLQEAQRLMAQFDNTTLQERSGEFLGRTWLLVGNDRAAINVLRPLAQLSVLRGNRLKANSLYLLLESAYADLGRFDSAYYYAQHGRTLTDSLRAAQQYAALAAVETRFRTREKELQIARLTDRAAEQRRWNRLAWASGILLAALLAGGLLWWYRRRQSRRELAMRTRLAADLHDDVGSLLSQISLQSALMKDGLYSPDEQREQLQEMADASRAAVRLLNDVVWAIDAHNDHLTNLVDRMHDYAFEVLHPAGVEVQFDAPDDLPTVDRLPVLVRRNLYLIYKEALHNVVKHAHAQQVQVTLLHHGGWLRLRVQDDGRGPGPHARSSGHGLRNMRQRAAEAGGETTSAAVPGGGFAVEVRLPVA